MCIRSGASTVHLNWITFSEKKTTRRTWSQLMALLGLAILGLMAAPWTQGQNAPGSIRFDPRTNIFRIDGADVSYAFGINEKKQVQTLYWGKRLNPEDTFAAAQSSAVTSSFDLPVNTTQQEFVGWGGGLYVEPI